MRPQAAKTLLLQFIVVVILSNTAMASSACCFPVSADKTTTEMVSPCHQADEGDTLDRPGDCCIMCLPMMMPSAHAVGIDSQVNMITHSCEPLARNSTDPPFRPPTDRLS